MPDTSETRVKAGEYVYLLNGTRADVTETWSREALPTGEQSVISRRTAPGVVISVQSTVAEGRVMHCKIEWRSDAASIDATYSLSSGEWICRRQQEGHELEVRAQDVGDEGAGLLFPLMRTFTGPLIAQLLDRGGEGTVVVPAIREPGNTSGLLLPESSRRRARVLDPVTELVLDGTTVSCRLCEYTGDQYGVGSLFWLANDDTLLRYQWQQGAGQSWDVWLRRGAD